MRFAFEGFKRERVWGVCFLNVSSPNRSYGRPLTSNIFPVHVVRPVFTAYTRRTTRTSDGWALWSTFFSPGKVTPRTASHEEHDDRRTGAFLDHMVFIFLWSATISAQWSMTKLPVYHLVTFERRAVHRTEGKNRSFPCIFTRPKSSDRSRGTAVSTGRK